ncbi:MAG TPA: hypothetical protein VJ044_08305 [Candidatus Hodarchaeales archaeon]|nr:hypothetical protein [Candidatus Hodarchaeales archaeon]
MSDYWETIPLNLIAIQILNRRDGLMLDNELLTMMEQEVGYQIGLREFSKILMKLEVHGRIAVQSIKKNQRQIKLIREDHNYLAIGED